MNMEHSEPEIDPAWDDDPPEAIDAAADDAARMRADDIAQLEALQSMAAGFASWLYDKGAEQMEAGGDQAVDKVRQLSHSFNRAARNVRQIIILKQEVAGLRPTRHARPAAPAGRTPQSPARPATPAGGRASYDEMLESYLLNRTEEERDEDEARVDAWVDKLVAALDVDLQSAPPEIRAEAERQSIAIKLTRIASLIPHPNLDKTLVALEMGKLWDMWGPKNMERPTSIGPPVPD